MIEFLFKLAVLLSIVMALFAILMTFPSFIGILGAGLLDGAAVSSNITSGFELIAQYTRPFMGLMNLMIGSSGRIALTSLIIWLLAKPIVYKIMAPLELAIEKLVEKS